MKTVRINIQPMQREVVATFDYESARHLMHVLERAMRETPYDSGAGRYRDIRVLLPPATYEVTKLEW